MVPRHTESVIQTWVHRLLDRCHWDEASQLARIAGWEASLRVLDPKTANTYILCRVIGSIRDYRIWLGRKKRAGEVPFYEEDHPQEPSPHASINVSRLISDLSDTLTRNIDAQHRQCCVRVLSGDTFREAGESLGWSKTRAYRTWYKYLPMLQRAATRYTKGEIHDDTN